MHTRFCTLTDLGVFEVTGADARSFLNGQLSVDLSALPSGAAPLAAWSAANGRARALVRVVPIEAGYALLAPERMAETICKKLGMFVLRADVAIEPSTTHAVGAVLDAPPDWLAARGHGTRREDTAEPADATTWIRVGPGLHYVLGTQAELGVLAGEADAAPRAAVELAEIELGLPQIVPETAERFLPQMLDLDLLGGIAFDKGCFPGQEVIARTQNLGKVKRRLRRFAVDGPTPDPGAALYTPDGDEAGQALRTAHDADRTELLAVVRLGALTSRLHITTPDGPRLTELPFNPERNTLSPTETDTPKHA